MSAKRFNAAISVVGMKEPKVQKAVFTPAAWPHSMSVQLSPTIQSWVETRCPRRRAAAVRSGIAEGFISAQSPPPTTPAPK